MDIKDIDTLAELAKLDLNQAEKEKILSDMDGILDYVKQIQEVDVPDIDVTYTHRNIWREDVPRPAPDFSYELIISQFPDSQDGFLKVKKIL